MLSILQCTLLCCCIATLRATAAVNAYGAVFQKMEEFDLARKQSVEALVALRKKLHKDFAEYRHRHPPATSHEPTAKGIVRREHTDRGRLQKWMLEFIALVIAAVVLGYAIAAGVTLLIARSRKSKDKSPELRRETAWYPWEALPPVAHLQEVGLTYSTNFTSGLRKAFEERGLKPVETGKVALVSFLIPANSGTTPSAILERHSAVPPGSLGGKRALAMHLTRKGLEELAPATFLGPTALRRALQPKKGQALHAEGLWFLKHSTKDRNEGVTCFKGANALLSHWEEKMTKQERLRYVAQVEVPKPMLMEGRKMMIRAYVVTLPAGRCFLHRELLLKGHPQLYDVNDPDPLRHVISCVKHDGVISARGTEWAQYRSVMPGIAKMMTSCLGPSAVGNGKTPFVLREEGMVGAAWRHFYETASHFSRWFTGGRKAGALQYNLIGADIIVDRDLRPWLIELNPGPAMGIDQKDKLATDLRAEVMEDLCALLLDPLLQQMSQETKTQVPKRKQSTDAMVKDKNSQSRRHGFVEVTHDDYVFLT